MADATSNESSAPASIKCRIDNLGRECARCCVYKPWDEYPDVPGTGGSHGHYSYCYPCKREARKARRKAEPDREREQARAWRQANPERVRAREIARYQRDREKRLEQGRADYRRHAEARRELARVYRANNPERVATQQLRIAARRCAQDPDVIVAHFLSHNGLCDICGETARARDPKCQRLAIDHDHVTGKFRGLLCSPCNLSLGKFNDDPKILLAAADYLTRAADTNNS